VRSWPDPIASAFFQATNTSGAGSWDPRFAQLLKPRMWEKMVNMPTTASRCFPLYTRPKLNEHQRQIFRFYGYPT